MGNNNTSKSLAIILGFVLVFDLLSISVSQASIKGLTRGEIVYTNEVNSEVNKYDLASIVPPHEYLDIMLNLEEKTQKALEANSLANWQQFVNSSYELMVDEAPEVIGFYDTFSKCKTIEKAISGSIQIHDSVVKNADLVFAFFQDSNGIGGLSKPAEKWLSRVKEYQNNQGKSKVSKAMIFWNKVKNSKPNSSKELEDLKKKIKESNSQKSVETIKENAIAGKIAIGLSVINAALAVHKCFTNEDIQDGKLESYSSISTIGNAYFAVVALGVMFCSAPVSNILVFMGSAWDYATKLVEYAGECQKNRILAYKNSFWFLYQNDKAFKVYYDNPAKLSEEEKSSALKYAEKNYSQFRTLDYMTYEDEDKEIKRRIKNNNKVYENMEKQGILTSYYYREFPSETSVSMSELLKLWNAKADYMAWQPSEKEANEETDFWSFVKTIGKYTNYVSCITAVAEKNLEMYTENTFENVARTRKESLAIFNPDYTLMKKYQNYLTSNRLEDDFHKALGVRIEQSPFNFIYLLGINTSKWNEELFKEALAADSFFIGNREMSALHKQIEASIKSLKNQIETTDLYLKEIEEKRLPKYIELRELLFDLAMACKKRPNKIDRILMLRLTKLTGMPMNSDLDPTPINIAKRYKKHIKEALFYEPICLSYLGSQLVLTQTKLKEQLDFAVLMENYVKRKQASINSFESDFKSYQIKEYILTGNFLDQTSTSYFAGIDAPYDEAKSIITSLKKDIADYEEYAYIQASDQRDTLWFWKDEVTTPSQLLEVINEELPLWRDTVELWGSLYNKTAISVPLSTDEDYMDKVFAPYSLYDFELTALSE